MNYLRQSTASQEILLGPFLDDTDGKTAETALTIANTDIKVWKTGGTTESNKNSGGATHIAGGRYYAVLDATDTNTIGPLEVNVHVSGALPVKAKCCVLDEAVYDVLFGTTAPSTYAGGDTSGTTTLLSRIGAALTITSGRVNADVTHIATAAVSTSTAQLGVNVVNFGGSAGTFASGIPAVNATQISSDSVAADNAESFFDGTGYAGTNNVIPTVTNVTNLHASAATAAELAKVPKSDGTATWNATALASIQTEANDALVANNLDHLVLSAVDTNFATTVHLDSVIGYLADNGTSASFDRTTDSLEANRDNIGTAGAGLTAADDAVISAIGALNNITAASVWAVATRVLTAGTNIQLPANGLANVTAWTVDITGNLSGAVGSVAGAVGSVTGNVGGNVSGSVGSVVGAVGSVTGAVGSVTGNVGGNVTGSVGSVLGGINTTGGTITTLDALDTAQDTQHVTTQGLVTTADTVVDAIKVKTDQLTFGVANTVNANITYVNETAVGGTGATGDEWGPV